MDQYADEDAAGCGDIVSDCLDFDEWKKWRIDLAPWLGSAKSPSTAGCIQNPNGIGRRERYVERLDGAM